MATVGQQLLVPDSGYTRFDCNNSNFSYTANWYGDTSSGYPRKYENIANIENVGFNVSGTDSVRILIWDKVGYASAIRIIVDGVSQTINYNHTVSDSSLSPLHLATDIPLTESKEHSIAIFTTSDGVLAFNGIDIKSTGIVKTYDPWSGKTKTKISDMVIGDRISFEYTAPTAGQVGTFANLSTATKTEIPRASSATPDGKAYFIHVGYDLRGRMKLVCDRNIQHSLSWDAVNAAGLVDGVEIDIGGTKGVMRLMTGGISSTDTDNEWDQIIAGSTLNGTIVAGDNGVWNWQNKFSILSTTYNATLNRASNGYNTVSSKGYIASSTASETNCFRPVFLVPYSPYRFLIQVGTDIRTYSSGAWTSLGSITPTEDTFKTSGMSSLVLKVSF